MPVSGGGTSLNTGVLGVCNELRSVKAVGRIDGGLLGGRDSMNVLAGLENAASKTSCPVRGVPGLEPCNDGGEDGILSRS